MFLGILFGFRVVFNFDAYFNDTESLVVQIACFFISKVTIMTFEGLDLTEILRSGGID